MAALEKKQTRERRTTKEVDLLREKALKELSESNGRLTVKGMMKKYKLSPSTWYKQDDIGETRKDSPITLVKKSSSDINEIEELRAKNSKLQKIIDLLINS